MAGLEVCRNCPATFQRQRGEVEDPTKQLAEIGVAGEHFRYLVFGYHDYTGAKTTDGSSYYGGGGGVYADTLEQKYPNISSAFKDCVIDQTRTGSRRFPFERCQAISSLFSQLTPGAMYEEFHKDTQV